MGLAFVISTLKESSGEIYIPYVFTPLKDFS